MHNEFYSFGGLTLRLCCTQPMQPSALCAPFAVTACAAAHTIFAEISDDLPDIAPHACAHECEHSWQDGQTWCLKRVFGSRYCTFAARQDDTTRVRLSSGYRDSISARTILEAAGLTELLAQHGMLILHSSYVLTSQGDGIVFSGPSGVGKSTQAELWRRFAGAGVVNGDRALICPAEQTVHGILYSGTSGICHNVSAPLRAIVLPQQAQLNRVSTCAPRAAFTRLLNQCAYYPGSAQSASRMTELVAQLVNRVPVYDLACRVDEQAVRALQSVLYPSTGN